MKIPFTIGLLLLCLGINAQSRQDTILSYRLNKTAIRQVLANTRANTLVLEIFPLKRSDDISKADFDLLLQFKDTSCKIIYTNKNIPISDFERQTAHYISFLRAKKIPLDSMPVAYHSRVTRKPLLAADYLDIRILSPGLSHLIQFFQPVTPAPPGAFYALSCCKCPPLTNCCRSPQASTVEKLQQASITRSK